MRHAPLAMLGAGVAVVLIGCAVLAFAVNDYLGNPLAVSSTAGLRVFRSPDGSLGSYDFFRPGPGVTLITAGGVLMFASLFLLAVLWRGKAVSGRGWRSRIR
ncbi:hypothetical protein IWX81_001280 [Salinibacterium sp. CAN_S4]|uniref:hypothetical protein n=1 Tax=Salinibacterium sp. CAN_S4 TaxID=2787727 RepID=UPI0018EF43CE